MDYHFEPGSSQDGVSVFVPLTKLNQVPHTRCEWLVPGLLPEKVEALLRSLPQRHRRHLLPLGDYVEQFCQRHQTLSAQQTPLIKSLIQDVREHKQIALQETDFKVETLAPHLWMNFVIQDEHGQTLDKGRNFSALKSQFLDQARVLIQQGFQRGFQRDIEQNIEKQTGHQKAPNSQITSSHNETTKNQNKDNQPQTKSTIWTDWGFGQWQEMLEIQHPTGTILGYAALQDVGSGCELTVFESEDEAKRIHDLGLLRLIEIQNKDNIKQLQKNIPAHQLAVWWTGLSNSLFSSAKNTLGAAEMALALTRSALRSAYLSAAPSQSTRPQNAQQFQQWITQGRSRIGLILSEHTKLLDEVLSLAVQTSKKINGIKPLQQGIFFDDMRQQLQQLFEPHWVEGGFANGQLNHYPRYLKAMIMRADKAQNNQIRDVQSQKDIQRLHQTWIKLRQQQKGIIDTSLDELRWMIEELRVSLFAQELKTPMPISVKRIDKWIEQRRTR
jgi:ATP-dependent helicase HrpA